MRRGAAGIAACGTMAMLLLATPGRAQETSGKRRPVDSYASNLDKERARERKEMVALLPWSYRNGKNVAQQSAREICNQLLLETGFNVLLIKSPIGAMPPAMPGTGASKRPESPFNHILDEGHALLGQEVSARSDAPYVMPSNEQMEAVGEKLQTRYVLAGRAEWKSRNVWVGVANRVKAICTVDVRIFDMESKEVVLDAHDIVGDSTEQKNMFSSISSVVSLNPLPLVLPGSVTPEEQRAVTAATTRALKPWIHKQRIHFALDQADRTAVATTSGASNISNPSEQESNRQLLLSPLVSSPTDLRARLHITTTDPHQLALFDADLAKLAAAGDVALKYTDPNRLRLDTDPAPDGQKFLWLDDDNRRFITIENVPEPKPGQKSDKKSDKKSDQKAEKATAKPAKPVNKATDSSAHAMPADTSESDLPPIKTNQRRKVVVQDLSTNPTRQISPLDLCGVLTSGMFDYLRARFVRPEKLNGQNVVVYDLTYWGIEESPYRRVWLDSVTRTAVKQEVYDKYGKLKTVYTYERPVEVGNQLRLPTRIEITDANHKEIARILLTVDSQK